MPESKMNVVTGAFRGVGPGSSRAQRRANAARARDRRLPSPRGGGRAWINGREVGGPDSRYAHLQPSYD